MDSAKTTLKISWKALAICSLLFGCIQKQTVFTKEKLNTVTFTNFICSDLSEDQAQLSTKDDEVIVVYGLIYSNKERMITQTDITYSSLYTVQKNIPIELNKAFHIKNELKLKPILFIGLIEIDDHINIESIVAEFIHQVTTTSITKTNTIWQNVLDRPTTSNDNLGTILQHTHSGTNTYLIAGNQLTDRYQYLFNTIIN